MTATNHPRHFLDLSDLDSPTLRALLEHAKQLKAQRRQSEEHAHLKGKHLAMIFEKPSTRTRVSFEVGIRELGGDALFLSRNDLQLGRGETIADTARVLSRYVHLILLRAMRHESLVELAAHAQVPVINALTDRSHPCQVMADVMTFEEHRGPIAGKTVAWIGDGNNVCQSWMQAAEKFGFTLHVSSPGLYVPMKEQFRADAKDRGHWQGFPHSRYMEDPWKAVVGADAVVADTWVSMGEENLETKTRAFQPYQVTEKLMDAANKGAVFMHCLPAHRGDEMTDGVIDGPLSVVFDEAENRLHVQKAIMCWCMGAGR